IGNGVQYGGQPYHRLLVRVFEKIGRQRSPYARTGVLPRFGKHLRRKADTPISSNIERYFRPGLVHVSGLLHLIRFFWRRVRPNPSVRPPVLMAARFFHRLSYPIKQVDSNCPYSLLALSTRNRVREPLSWWISYLKSVDY